MKKIIPFLIIGAAILGVLGYGWLPGFLVKWAVQSERKVAGLQYKTIQIGNHKIVYLEAGQGETILMVHGFGGNKDNWTRFAKFISPATHILAVDLPGFGESTYLQKESYGIGDQAKRLNQFVEALGLKTFHIVGNSMGGNIAGRYALMFPEKILSLALFDTSGVGSPVPSEMSTRLSRGEPNPLVAGTVEEFDRLIRFVFSTPPKIPRVIKKALVEEAVKHKVGNERIFKQIRSENSDLIPDLGKIKAPTLILWGRQDRVIDVSAVEILAKGIANSRSVIMENCGHIPMIERPEETARHYLAFLKRR